MSRIGREGGDRYCRLYPAASFCACGVPGLYNTVCGAVPQCHPASPRCFLCYCATGNPIQPANLCHAGPIRLPIKKNPHSAVSENLGIQYPLFSNGGAFKKENLSAHTQKTCQSGCDASSSRSRCCLICRAFQRASARATHTPSRTLQGRG